MTGATQLGAKGYAEPRYRALIERLVAERKRSGLSQEAFAARLGKPQQFVSRYETGERRLDVVEYIDVARQLGIDVAAALKAVAPRD